MNIIGVELRKPSFTETTLSAVMAVGLWIAYVGISKAAGDAFDPVNAGGMLVVIFWGCICARIGIRIERGFKHLALNIGVGGILLLAYQATMAAVT